METWKTAFLKQARSDMRVFDVLQKDDKYPYCQQLHYLQMATGKLAKAYSPEASRGRRPVPVHTAFAHFLRSYGTRAEFSRIFEMSPRQFRTFVESLLPAARAIENLAPAGDVDKPNPEYPWENNNGIIAPVDYSFPELKLTTHQMRGLLKLVRVCMNVADDNA